MKPFKLVVATTALILSSNTTAHLESRLGGLAYYNDEADLTWLADANAGSFMPWNNARSWVEGLDVNGVTGWRLPNSLQPDPACSSQLSGGGTYGTNCTGSELDNLFYNVLGGVAGTSIETTNNNYNLFSNIQPTSIGQPQNFQVEMASSRVSTSSPASRTAQILALARAHGWFSRVMWAKCLYPLPSGYSAPVCSL